MRARILAVVLLTSSVSFAESKGYAALGVDDFIGVSLAGFAYSGKGHLIDNPSVPPEGMAPGETSFAGIYAGARFDVGGYLIETRFGTPAGMEFHFGIGYVNQSGTGQFLPSGGGRAFIETDTEVNVSIFAVQFGPVKMRLMALAGFGVNSDTAFGVVGGRLASVLVPKYVNIALAYSFRPAIVGGAQHRFEATLLSRWGVAIGAEYWRGSLNDSTTGLGALNGTLKADYSAFVGFAAYRWRDADD